jgi:hypothetical protein
VFSPPIAALARVIGDIAGGAESTAQRLRQAGLAMSVTDFRSRQLVWAAVAGGVGVAVAVGANRFQDVPVVAQAGM